MKRTTTRRQREWRRFLTDNRRLFPFAGLFLAGVMIGTVIFALGGSRLSGQWDGLLQVSGVTGGLKAGLGALGGACFSTVVLLAVLFLLGLWSCGAPFALAVPLFYGLGLGLSEARYYMLGWAGVRAVAVVLMPRGLLTATVLMMAGAESVRLSTGLSRHLLPVGEELPPQENMWPAFRLYMLRYLLFLLTALAAGLIDVVLRTVFARFLS